MKVYIENYPLEKLSKKIQQLSSYLINKRECIRIFSREGIFMIDEENTIYKLELIKEDVVINKNYYENYHLWIDNSEFIKEKVYQLPSQHIYEHFVVQYYSLHNKSNIKLIVQGTYKNNILDHSESLVLNDFYFEIINEKNLNLPMIKENLIEFLSLLN